MPENLLKDCHEFVLRNVENDFHFASAASPIWAMLLSQNCVMIGQIYEFLMIMSAAHDHIFSVSNPTKADQRILSSRQVDILSINLINITQKRT